MLRSRIFTLLLSVGFIAGATHAAMADNYYHPCFGVHHTIAPTGNIVTEISISDVSNMSIGSVNVYDDTGKIIKAFSGSVLPGNMKVAQYPYQTQSFTTKDIFANQNIGRITVRVGFFLSPTDTPPIVVLTETYFKPDGSIAAKVRDYCS